MQQIEDIYDDDSKEDMEQEIYIYRLCIFKSFI